MCVSPLLFIWMQVLDEIWHYYLGPIFNIAQNHLLHIASGDNITGV